MLQNNKINICVSCDNKYARHAGVLIASILANANSDDELSFYILDGGIKETNKEKILSLKSIKNCDISFVNIDESLFEDYKKVKTHKYISTAAYYRLKLPSLLPNVDKIIYLDCDVIVNHSFNELFNIDFENNFALAVQDINKKMIKINPNYVNSGMIVFDLKAMREKNIEQEFLDYTKSHIEQITMGDQEIINKVLENRIKLVDDSWNVQSSNFINRSSYTKNPKLVHFVSAKKPWHYPSFSVHKSLYFKYLQLTPWKLSQKDFVHWTRDNQIYSIFAYLIYRPFFLFRPRFYVAFYNVYLKDIFKK